MKIDFLFWLAGVILAIFGCPIIPGIINRTKAKFAGRHGAPILQLYWDMLRLFKKSTICSSTACGLVRLGPIVSVSGTLLALLFLPLGLADSPLAFTGDIILVLYILGTVRFTTVLGALDTGSAFEGMGASRELQFSALAEIATLAIVIFLAILTKTFTLNGMLNSADSSIYLVNATPMVLVVIAAFLVMLCENCRVPFDDPETHLELTMIHEAMVLDNGGPDLAMIHYGAALKLWFFGAFIVTMIIPTGVLSGILGFAVQTVGILVIGILIGIVESVMARCRFFKVPQLLITAFSLAFAAILLHLLLREI